MGLRDDGAGNIYFEISTDGVNFFTLSKIVKSSGYLGSSGYNQIFLGIAPWDFSNTPTLPVAWSFLAYDPNGLSRSLSTPGT
jgi:hypothetical protein